MKPRILLVDDDLFLCGSLQRVLERQGYEVHAVYSIAAARETFPLKQPSLVVLDLELPDGDGNELCAWIRRRSNVPLLILSSRSSSMDKVLGLNNGADDYLAKPFDGHEFLARVRAQLRRISPERGLLEHGGIRLDPRAKRAFCLGREVEFTATEFRILECLLERADETIERGHLFKLIWGHEIEFSSNTLDVLISRIRRKILASGGSDPIQTVRGVGYRLRP